MKILVTAFDAFLKVKQNCTVAVLQRLPMDFGNDQLYPHLLPTEFAKAGTRIAALLSEIVPDIAVSLGMAPNSSVVQLERFAVNLVDTRYPDNAGYKADEEVIQALAPTAYQVPGLASLRDALRKVGIAAAVSNSAGTFVCNNTMYRALDTIQHRGLATRYLFIHLPALPAEVAARTEDNRNGPSCALETMVDAVRYAIEWSAGRLLHPALLTRITSSGLLLRPWQAADIWRLLPTIGYSHDEWRPYVFFNTISEMQEWWQQRRQFANAFSYALCTPVEEVVGEIYLTPASVPDTMLVQVRILPDHWRQGYASQGLRAISEFLFANNIARCCRVVLPTQQLSAIRCYQAAGFTVVDTIWADSHHYFGVGTNQRQQYFIMDLANEK